MRHRIGKFLWLILTAVLCVAPWIERAHGTASVHSHLYGHWAFLLLWCLGVGYGIYLTVCGKMWRKIDVFLMHSAVFFILFGSVFTFFNTKLSLTIGKWTTYFGFLQFGIGYLCFLLKKDGPFRTLLRRLSLVALLVALHLPNAFSQRTVSEADAERIGKEVVAYNGRQAPFKSVCDEWLRQIYGRSHYRHFSSVEVAMGWILYPEDWMCEPFVKVEKRNVRARLNGRKYAAPQDFFTPDGNYVFENQSFANKEKIDGKLGLLQTMRWNGVSAIPAQQLDSPFRMRCEYAYDIVRPWITSGAVSGVLAIFSLFMFFKIVLQKSDSSFFTNFKKILYLLIAGETVVVWLHWLVRWYLAGHVPLGTGYDSLLFLAGFILLTTIVLWKRHWMVSIAGLAMTALALLATHFSFNSPQLSVLPGILQTPWLSLHVTIAMAAYAGLAFTFFLSVVFLIMQKRKSEDAVLQSITDLSKVMLLPSVGLLALGIMLGAVWAQQAWGSYWTWDPKEVWALITFLGYAPAVQTRFFTRFEQKRFYHIYILFIFSFVIMTYFGVNVLFGGMHAY